MTGTKNGESRSAGTEAAFMCNHVSNYEVSMPGKSGYVNQQEALP